MKLKLWRILGVVLIAAGLFTGCAEPDDYYYDDAGYADEYEGEEFYADEYDDDEYEDEEFYDDEAYADDDEEWLDEDYYELPEDCLPDEVYDEEDQLCYPAVDCEDEECAYYEEDLVDLFFALVAEILEPMDAAHEGFDPESEKVLVTYQIQGNRIGNPEEAAITADLRGYQQDTTTHQKIWSYFADMFPQENRTYLTEFVIFTDGAEEGLAAVEQDRDDMHSWVLAVDIVDAGDPEELTYTLVHEYGHLLTLNPAQVKPDPEIFAEPDNDEVYEDAAASCATYFPGEGCSAASSYINEFFDRFWVDIYDEWDELGYIEDEEEYYEALDDFYYQYEDQFVTDYAATSPEEDIAEAWAHFILQPKPAGETIAEQKVLFFYEQPELVRLRAQIVARTYSRLRRR